MATRVPIAPSRGITHLRRRDSVVHISFVPPESGNPKLSEVFGALSRRGINVFFIKKSPTGIGLAVDIENLEKTTEALEKVGVKASVQSDCAVACVVASNMRYAPGVMQRIVQAINKAGVKLLSTSDSFNSVSCLVPRADIDRAVQALSEEFEIQESETPGPLDPW